MANEKRLIDANELLAKMAKPYYQKCGTKRVPASATVWAAALVNNAPTVDAVEVVRCMNCEHWEGNEETRGDGYCKHGHWAIFDVCDPVTMANDFCSYGERREGE